MEIQKKVSRRDFVRLTGIAAGAAALAACATPTPQVIKETVVVKETVPVKEVVKETVAVEKVVTKEVEKVVTATPVPTEAPKPVKVVFWTDPLFAKPPRRPEFTEIGQYENWQAEQFKKMNPHVTVEVLAMDWADLPKKVPAAVAAGTPPDIMKDYLGRTSGFAYSDVLVKLDQQLPKETIDDLLPGVRDLYMIKGYLHAYPVYFWEHHLSVNKALFDKAGLTNMLPFDDYDWTFDEFYAAAKAIKQAGVGVEYPLGLQVASEQGDYDIHAFFWGAGAYTWKPDCSGLDYDNPKALEALKFVKKLYDEGLINPDAPTLGWQGVQALFLTGKAACIGGGLSFINVTVPQKIADGTVTGPMDAKIMTYPHLPGEKNGLAIGPTGMMVFKRDKRTDYELKWVIKFLEFLIGEDQIRDYCLNSSQFPSRKSVGTPLAGDPNYELALKLVAEKGTESMGLSCPHFYEIRVAQPPEWQAVFLGKKTPEQALADIMKASKDILSK